MQDDILGIKMQLSLDLCCKLQANELRLSQTTNSFYKFVNLKCLRPIFVHGILTRACAIVNVRKHRPLIF